MEKKEKTRLMMVAAKIMAGLLAQERHEHGYDFYHDDETLVSRSVRLAKKLENAVEAEDAESETCDRKATEEKFLAMLLDEPENFDEPF